ncbi:MAG TPA: GWxTD domain-containing protein [Candidatus Eisenbacteria bacterium]
MRRPRLKSAVVGLLLATAAAGLPRAPAGAAGTASTESQGDLGYHAYPIAFRHGPNEARAEFFIRIPYREIKFVPVDTLYEGRLRLTVELWDGAQKRVGFLQREARAQVLDVATASDSLLGEIYSLGLAEKPGRYHYRVTVEDMNVARMGLVYKMKNQKRQGRVEGDIDMGAWLFREPGLSGLELAWQIGPRSENAPFAKGPYEVLPQPSRYFGLYRDLVSLYYEIYDSPPGPEGRSYRLRTRIWSSTGDTLHTSVDSLHVTEGTAWPHAIAVDASAFPAGHYFVRLDLSREGENVEASSQTEFDVLWQPDSWRADASEFYDVAASALLSAQDASEFRSLSMGEKETRIEKAWQDADPSPETAENEMRAEFQRRVAYANEHFTVFTPGMFTDRGRVYIRYGEPDEIKSERLPVNDKTLGYALGNTIPEASKDQLTNTESGVADIRPYEIWTYYAKGKEVVEHFGMNELTNGMKFVFTDDQGYGEYVLRYSSTSGMH